MPNSALVKDHRMLLDTDVMVDLMRGYAPAVSWLTSYTAPSRQT